MKNTHFLDSRIEPWFKKRGISEKTIEDFGVWWDSDGIYIPIKDHDNNLLFNKTRRLPEDHTSTKYLLPKGATAQLFGQQFLHLSETVFITEGELDAMVMYSSRQIAVSSTNGCKTFKDEWVQLLEGKEVYICYDNDQAGQEGMAKMYNHFPNAKYIFLPKEAYVKDISDYNERGGDVHKLKSLAVSFANIDDIEQDMSRRKAMWQDTYFHRAILKTALKEEKKYVRKDNEEFDTDKERAKAIPITEFIDFRPHRKALCLYHEESTPSMTYYPQTNTFYCWGCDKSGDVIDIIMKQKDMTFKQAMDFLNNKY